MEDSGRSSEIKSLEARRARRKAIMEKHRPHASQGKLSQRAPGERPASASSTPPASAAAGAGDAASLEHDSGSSSEEDIFATAESDDVQALAQAGRLGDTTAAAVTKRAESLQLLESSKRAAAAPQSTADNFDDAEGYLKTRVGEVIGDRYVVQGSAGRGVFGMVSLCQDTGGSASSQGLATSMEPALAPSGESRVAVKILRANDTMRKAGMKEAEMLRTVRAADPTGAGHVVRLLNTFEHRDHLCLAFEAMHMNLKEVQDKFGKGIGLSIDAVSHFARQLLKGLHTLGKCGIIHADLKPQNILANEAFNVVKIADLGSAFLQHSQDNVPTPILCSRYYRAPETILGLKHTCALDMWSLAAVLFELFTGQVLFPGSDNNHMLHIIQQVVGRFPNKLVKRHLREAPLHDIELHFGDDFRFIFLEPDPVTNAVVPRPTVVPQKPVNPIRDRLAATQASTESLKKVRAFQDLLERMLNPDPAKRIEVTGALAHPFVNQTK